MIKFPGGFFWGAATSAYQVEGNNLNCDWWEWEKRVGLSKPSGAACRHYELYKQDFDLAKLLNHNAHRLSIEWSRIEPKEGKFSSQELNHYIDVILSLRKRNIEPIVTLHHFTNPLWFTKIGGWENKKARDYFFRYASKVIDALADKVKYWVTINEPNVYAYHSYILGMWPPQKRSFLSARRVVNNLAASHVQVYKLIHAIYNERNLSAPLVSIAQNLQAFFSCSPSLKNKFATYLRDKFFNFAFIERLLCQKSLDFIGINYYTRSLVDIESWSFRHLLLDRRSKNRLPVKKNSLGWDIYPMGLLTLLLRLKKYKLPVFILENGICTEEDDLRWDFIYEHLRNTHLAIERGVKVLGYIYWSLIDNFEWDKGFRPRFGLIEVDYQTFQRRIRESAKKFSEVCKTGIL